MRNVRLRKMICLLVSLLILSGCSLSLKIVEGEHQRPIWSPHSDEAEPSLEAERPIPDAAMAIVDHLELRQKVGQLVIASFDGTEKPADLQLLLEEYQVSGLLLFPRNIVSTEQLQQLIQYGKSLATSSQLVLRLPPFWCLAEEGGTLQRIPNTLDRLESTAAIGTLSDEIARRYGERIGIAFNQLGLNANLGPVFDIGGTNEQVASRSFGTNAAAVAVKASEVSKGLRAQGVIPIAKHFPGTGDVTHSVYGDFDRLSKDYSQLLSHELLPFTTAIDRGLEMMLVSHTVVAELDPAKPASLSPVVINDLLREALGYQGIVICDDLNASLLTAHYDPGEAAVEAILAGCDMVLVCHSREDQLRVLEAIYAACEDGTIPIERLNSIVARIVALKQKYLMN